MEKENQANFHYIEVTKRCDNDHHTDIINPNTF
jgi:hypothetical protein